MAVTPSSLSTLSDNEQAIVARTETAIDAELRLQFETGKPVYVRNVIVRDALAENVRVINTIKALYTAAGWDIVEYDSPEGRWFSFSES